MGSLRPVFQGADQFCQESIGLVTIQDAVVDGQADVTHRPDGHDILTINFQYFDAFFNLSDTKDSGLWLIDDDRRGDQAAGDTVVGNREGAVADIFRF